MGNVNGHSSLIVILPERILRFEYCVLITTYFQSEMNRNHHSEKVKMAGVDHTD